MFDQLSGNIDRNQGNLLYDAEYHVVLIDHSRAFVDTVDVTKYQKYLFVDQPLWERMQALTMESLQPALGKWVSKGCLIAILQRRDKMGVEIERMRAKRGDAVWLR
jgi:16S rRNA G966 N2-methylase RsmD